MRTQSWGYDPLAGGSAFIWADFIGLAVLTTGDTAFFWGYKMMIKRSYYIMMTLICFVRFILLLVMCALIRIFLYILKLIFKD